MSSYHISDNGVANKCKAKTPESCKYSKESGTVQPHYKSKAEAQEAYEDQQKQDLMTKLAKDKNKKFEKVELPETIYAHPDGYEFQQNFDNAKTSAKQAETVRNLETVRNFRPKNAFDRDAILGKDSADFKKGIRNEIVKNEGDLNSPATEYNVHVLQNSDDKFSVWLLDEDQLFVGARHNVSADEGYDNVLDIYAEDRRNGHKRDESDQTEW